MNKSLPPNPILEYVRNLLASGKTTKEKICVAADLKYPTFDNLFNRPTVSQMVRRSLLWAEIIPMSISKQYDVWMQTIYLPNQKGKDAHRKTRPRSKNKQQRKARRAETDGENALL